MSDLSKLPRVSDAFLNHIRGRTLEKNEWIPCPRCGESTVEPPSGALTGGCAGTSLIGCWILWVIVVTTVLAVVFWPAAVIAGIIGLIVIPLLPTIGAVLGMLYRCKSCGYNWTFKDAEKYKESGH